MMIVLALIMLTALDGTPVWVESTAVQVIRPSTAHCKSGHGAAIRVTSMALCVRETPEEIRGKLKDAK